MSMDKQPTPESIKNRGVEAEQLLRNPLLKEALEEVGNYVERLALSCDPSDSERARRIIVSKQLIVAIEREIRKFIQDGEIARIQIAELERKRTFSDKIFRR